MDSRDIFRRFFGFPNRHPSTADLGWEDHDDESPRDDGHDHDDGFSFFFGDSSKGLEGMFEHFHGDMWRQMETLHREMKDMMRGFGAIDFPSTFDQPQLRPLDPDGQGKPETHGKIFTWSTVPNPFFKHSEKASPRDFMLKDGLEDDFQPGMPALPGPPAVIDKPKIGSVSPVPRWNLPASLNKIDTDLDGKISEDKLLELIKHPERQPQTEAKSDLDKPSLFTSKRKTISVSTIRGPDNKVEHKRTMRNSSGQEESTVTRSMGDKSYTVTMVTEKDGTQTRHQTFKNMDESEVGKFEDEWNKRQQPQINASADTFKPTWSPHLDTDDEKLFSKFFN